VLVPNGKGGLEGRIVCPKCVALALLILPVQPAAMCVGCMKPDHDPQFCGTCADERALAFHQKKQKLDAGATKVRKIVEAYKATRHEQSAHELPWLDGRIAGLEQALSLLEDGR
jgi:hypothetical protein